MINEEHCPATKQNVFQSIRYFHNPVLSLNHPHYLICRTWNGCVNSSSRVGGGVPYKFKDLKQILWTLKCCKHKSFQRGINVMTELGQMGGNGVWKGLAKQKVKNSPIKSSVAIFGMLVQYCQIWFFRGNPRLSLNGRSSKDYTLVTKF